MPDISVIIPTYNSRDLLVECLEALEKNTLDRSRFEVVVIDDGSTDGTSDMVEMFKRSSAMDIVLHVRDRANGFGPGVARNDGLKIARGTVIAFTDADCRPDPDWLTEVERVTFHDGHAVVSGEVWCDDVLLFPRKMSPAGQMGVTANFVFDRSKAKPVFFSPEFNGLIGDDTDFRLRLLASELEQIHEPSVRVFHAPRHMSLQQVIKRSVYRKHDVLLAKRFGKLANQSLNPLLRPCFFGHVSPVAVLTVLGLVVSAVFWNASWFLPILLIFSVLFSALFLLRFYRLCIMYTPKNPQPVSFRDRLKTLVAVVIYIPCMLFARIIGSIEYRYLMI